MIAMIDYGVGNLFSLQSSFAMIGQDVVVTGDKKVIADADRLILPGVGAFGDAANKLRSTFSMALYDNVTGKKVSKVIQTSIEACAKGHIGGANNDLVIALMRYGDSVSKVG